MKNNGDKISGFQRITHLASAGAVDPSVRDMVSIPLMTALLMPAIPSSTRQLTLLKLLAINSSTPFTEGMVMPDGKTGGFFLFLSPVVRVLKEEDAEEEEAQEVLE